MEKIYQMIITTVITLSDFSYFEIKLEDNSITNGSTIDCTDEVNKYLDICPKDQDGKIEKTSQCTEHYIYLINLKKELIMTKENFIFKFEIDCLSLENNNFIIIKFKKNDTTGIFTFDIKKN